MANRFWLLIPQILIQVLSRISNMSHRPLPPHSWKKVEALLSLHSIQFKGFRDMSSCNKSKRWLRQKMHKDSVVIIVWHTMRLLKWFQTSNILHKSSSNINSSILLHKWIIIWPSSQTIQTSCLYKAQTFKVRLLVFQIKVWCSIALTALITCSFIL